MNLLHLKFFCDAATLNSISEAAKSNFVTQSAVSQGISKLEKTIGAQLLIHSKQKFKLTREGLIVFEQAKHVFKSIQNIQEGIKSQEARPIEGVVKMATTKSLGTSFIPPLFKRAKALLPTVELQMELTSHSNIRHQLKQWEVEFGIIVFHPNFNQFAKHPLKRGNIRLYQSLDVHPDQSEPAILVNNLKGAFVSDLEALLAKQSKLKIQTEIPGWEAIARFTELGLGLGFFPDYIIANNPHLRVKPYPQLEIPDYEYQICAIYNKEDKLSRAASALIDKFSSEST